MTPTVPWIVPWVALGGAFLALFADRRRPLSLWNLDLVMLLAIGAPHFFSYEFGADEPFGINGRGFMLAACLAYLVLRMLAIGFGRGGRLPARGSVLAVRGGGLLLWVLGGLVLVRLGVAVGDHAGVVDVGEFSSIGADRLVHDPGALYEEPLPAEPGGGRDYARYGAMLYLAYLPFDIVFPWQESGKGAVAAALAFDVLAAAALWLLGRRIVPGEAGGRLGLALAIGWFAYPYTFYVIWESFNDGLVALLVICCLIPLRAPILRGALAALAGASKFVPLALVPLLAVGTGTGRERSARALLGFGAAFAALMLAFFLPVLPDGGLRGLYDVTVGFQAGRGGNLATLWEAYDGLDWLQTVLRVAAAALALAVAVVPRARTPVTVAALGAAVVCAVQLSTTAWFPSYVLWFAPLALVALAGRLVAGDATSAAAPHPA